MQFVRPEDDSHSQGIGRRECDSFSHWAAQPVFTCLLTSHERHEIILPQSLERTVRAAMRLRFVEPILGLPSGSARSEIGTVPVRGPPMSDPGDTRGKRPGALGLGLSPFRLGRSESE